MQLRLEFFKCLREVVASTCGKCAITCLNLPSDLGCTPKEVPPRPDEVISSGRLVWKGTCVEGGRGRGESRKEGNWEMGVKQQTKKDTGEDSG